MEKGITFVGLDAHKVSINVAMLLPGRTVAVEWQMREREGVSSPDGEEGRSERRQGKFGFATRRGPADTRFSVGSGRPGRGAWWWRRR